MARVVALSLAVLLSIFGDAQAESPAARQLLFSSAPNLFQFRRAITIDNTGNASALTNYQVSVSLSSSNFSFSSATPTGQDIRFTDSDGSTEIPYWAESWSQSGQTATLWVQVPSIFGSATKTIYLYYGNRHAPSASNCPNTFIFCDDFSGVTGWNKFALAPVVNVAAATWESSKVGDPWVICAGGSYPCDMWYWGYNGSIGQIGYASCASATSCSKSGSNPVLTVGSAGAYDDLLAVKPSVVLNGATYYLFYQCVKNGATTTALCVATSSSKTGPFTKYASNPIITPTQGWEGVQVDCPDVMFDTDDNTWKMWYSGGGLVNGEPVKWGFATSSDGFTWTKFAGNPIGVPPGTGGFNNSALGGTHVVKANGVYTNYYNAFDLGAVSRIGITTSSSPTSWAPASTDLVLGLSPFSVQFDSKQAYRPHVQAVSGQQVMWYNGMQTGDSLERIGAAYYGVGIDTTKWSWFAQGIPSNTISNGAMVIADATPTGATNSSIIETASYVPANNVIIETRANIQVVSDAAAGQVNYTLMLNGVPFTSGSSTNQFLFADRGTTNVKHQSRNSGTFGSEDLVYGSFPTTGTWYRTRSVKLSTGINWYFLDDSNSVLGSLVGNTDPPTNISFPVAVGVRGTTAAFDWFRTRVYTTPEPSTSVGAQQSAGKFLN